MNDPGPRPLWTALAVLGLTVLVGLACAGVIAAVAHLTD